LGDLVKHLLSGMDSKGREIFLNEQGRISPDLVTLVNGAAISDSNRFHLRLRRGTGSSWSHRPADDEIRCGQLGRKKNLTAEVAEHAEVKTAKGSGCTGPISKTFRKVRTPKGLSKKDLCVLRFLLVHPLVFMGGGSRERRSLIPKRRKEPQTAEIREDAERRKYG